MAKLSNMTIWLKWPDQSWINGERMTYEIVDSRSGEVVDIANSHDEAADALD